MGKPVRVDTLLAAGTRIMINVRSETRDGDTRYVPYITYAHGSFNETENSLRVAWPIKFGADDAPLEGSNSASPADYLSGNWEVMTVPTTNVPKVGDNFVCHGVPSTSTGWVNPSASGNIAGGLNSGTTDITKSIVLGYMTNARFEGAILKTADITK